jgi:hypothetical protein
MNPISRFALFTVALIAIAAIASQPRHGLSLTKSMHRTSLSKSMKDMCVCVPARAALIAKTALAKTQAASVELLKAAAR